MPYTERMAEAFLQAKEQQGQQEPQGVPVQGTAPGVQGEVNWPKYRKPTKEEADKHIAETKGMLGIGAAGLGLLTGGVAGGVAATGAGSVGKGLGDIFAPQIENRIRNTEWVPDYGHWTDSDFQGAYWGI